MVLGFSSASHACFSPHLLLPKRRQDANNTQLCPIRWQRTLSRTMQDGTFLDNKARWSPRLNYSCPSPPHLVDVKVGWNVWRMRQELPIEKLKMAYLWRPWHLLGTLVYRTLWAKDQGADQAGQCFKNTEKSKHLEPHEWIKKKSIN